MKHSEFSVSGSVVFPAFLQERVYMEEFTMNGLPTSLRRWQTTVDAMLKDVGEFSKAFIMIDQSKVYEGGTQRRPGLHIDGNWSATLGYDEPGQHIGESKLAWSDTSQQLRPKGRSLRSSKGSQVLGCNPSCC